MQASQLIALMSGGADWNQNDRVLKLSTPSGADALLAETARIEECLGPVREHAGFRIQLTVLSCDAHQPLTVLLGQPARLDLLTSHSRTDLRSFHGHITRAERLGANGGFARYALTIEPWLAFLAQNQDSYIHQDQTVIEIVDAVLNRWQGQGILAPAWRWDLVDTTAYPKRGMTTQYQESDLDFLRRLMAEEGLFTWFEHTAEDGVMLGHHTLVIADHNGAFADDPQQATWRYTQPGATLDEDSVDRWISERRLDSTELVAGSWDYRSLNTRPQSASTTIDNGASLNLPAQDDPGQYAWQTQAQGERLIGNHQQALDARAKTFHGAGTVRSAGPGRTFTLADHAEHPDDNHFLITAIVHHARNNLSERIPAGLAFSSPLPPGEGLGVRGADCNSFDTPEANLYRNEFDALRAAIPWRPLLADGRGRWLHPRPTAEGPHSAIVVGPGAPTHTDRDLRIKVQFPWQRGGNAASRNAHPSGSDNAPADASLGVWVRLLAPVAGANWGGHAVPRPGQEVLVQFQHGNIDRPLVIGALYNGQGQTDAQGNQQNGGGSDASANAPAWFAGESAQPHRHNAALSGLKSQQLDASRGGQGGYNQLVFDDSPGQSRIELGTTEYQSRLQLGHLKQQTDNARQADRGHGAELSTQASAALRAGSGLLISADARNNASGNHLDSREAQAQTEQAHALGVALADTAAKQHAALKDDPAADKLPAHQGLAHANEVLASTDATGTANAGSGQFKATEGGTGTVPAWSEPRLQYSAPKGIVQATSQDAIIATGTHMILNAGHDIGLVAQGNQSVAIKDGLALFTVGKAGNPQKPNQETGLHLHAASGKVAIEAQSGKLTAAADKNVIVASTTASLNARAKGHLLATAGGAYLKIEGGDIQLHAPGSVTFHASMKNLTGPASASAGEMCLPNGDFELPKVEPVLRSLQWQLHSGLDGVAQSNVPYQIVSDGKVVAEGRTDISGQTQRHTEESFHRPAEVWFGESGWSVQVEPEDGATPVPLDDQVYDNDDDLQEE